ncbi:MAG TPA: helix-turn-helix transcriptional regulator [Bryobacteraceae bacterium]|nr:helix-turn-helix transcriptional regulator [Bryobacteraceae bacterium]
MPTDFQRLYSRLMVVLQERIRSGEWTERRLALRAGVSQPHLHNVLRGKRLLSPAMADRILHSLHLDLAELLARDDSQ